MVSKAIKLQKLSAAYVISGVRFETVNPEPCNRLSQFGKGLPITCQCSLCIARGGAA